jgi:hypothetical protein
MQRACHWTVGIRIRTTQASVAFLFCIRDDGMGWPSCEGGAWAFIACTRGIGGKDAFYGEYPGPPRQNCRQRRSGLNIGR